MKKCSEVMTQNLVCCLPTDTASKAAQLMKDEDVGSIPVIEDEQTMKLIGIVTDRDLALQVGHVFLLIEEGNDDGNLGRVGHGGVKREA